MFTLNYLTSIILAPYGHKRQTEAYILKEKRIKLNQIIIKKKYSSQANSGHNITEIC